MRKNLFIKINIYVKLSLFLYKTNKILIFFKRLINFMRLFYKKN